MALFAALRDPSFGRGRALAGAALLPLPAALGALLGAPILHTTFFFVAALLITAIVAFTDGFLKGDNRFCDAVLPAFGLPVITYVLVYYWFKSSVPLLLLVGAGLWLAQLLLLLWVAVKIHRQQHAGLEEFAKGLPPFEEL